MPANQHKNLPADEKPPVPTVWTKITAVVILTLIVTTPIWFTLGSGPLFRMISPVICPGGSRLVTRWYHDTSLSLPNPKYRDKVNFDCVNPTGQSVENQAEVILFLACGGPFCGLMLWGFVGTIFRNRRSKLKPPQAHKKM